MAAHKGPVRERPARLISVGADPRFAIPRPAPGHVPRPRLVERLGRPGAVPLVVVTGPPGSGKSALVADWVRQADIRTRTGWITFDNDQSDLWGSITHCLAHLGLDLVNDPPGAGPGQPDAAHLADTVSAAAPTADRFLVVLDGLELTSPRLARQVDFVLRRLHHQLVLAITSRVDPGLPLAWYRRRGWSVEVREADLRCTTEECISVLAAAGVRRPAEHAEAVAGQAGGWLGGVLLTAALARNAPVAGVSALPVTSGEGSLQEQLLRQVLDTRPETDRQLLLLSSVLDHPRPGLAERVAGPDAGRVVTLLEELPELLEPVPPGPGGWRLQPMVRDLLRAHLAFENPLAWERANRRAAGWYRDHGDLDAAIAHLVRVDAWREVSDLLVESLQVPRIVAGTADEAYWDIATRVPDEIKTRSARLVRSAVHLSRGQEHEAAVELESAERALGRSVQQAEVTSAALAAWCASRRSEVPTAEAAVTAASEAIAGFDRAGADHPGVAVLRALVELSGAYVRLRAGDLEVARLAMGDAYDRAPADALWLRVMASGYAAVASALQGRLTDAGATAAHAVSLLEESGTPRGRRSGLPYLALAYVALERGDLTATRRLRDHADETLHAGDGPVETALLALVRAGTQQAEPGARTARPSPRTTDTLRPTSPALADLILIDAARTALPENPPQALGLLDALHDLDQPAAAVVRAAALRHTDPGRAQQLLERAASSPGNLRTEVERLIVRAELELQRAGIAGGLRWLDDALALAAPESLHRPFDNVSAAADYVLHTDTRLRAKHPWLVKNHRRRPRTTDSPGRRAASGAPPPVATAGVPAETPTVGRDAPGETAQLIEPLTVKEMEVLTHLNHLLDTEEIAEVMVVSVNTVRTHVRHVLRKLGVDRRNAAVRRAWELGLLPGPDVR